MDIVANRRLKLQHLIDTQYGGSQAAFALKTEINQGELSGLLRNKSFGEKKARKLEQLAALPSGYLDYPIGGDQDVGKQELLKIYDQLNDDNLRHLLLEQAKAIYNATKK